VRRRARCKWINSEIETDEKKVLRPATSARYGEGGVLGAWTGVGKGKRARTPVYT